MSSYLTLVVRTPDNDPDAKTRIQESLRVLELYRTAMSLEQGRGNPPRSGEEG